MLHRRLPLIAALIAVLLCLPSLGAGLIGDDYYHRAVLLREGALSGADPVWELFSFLVAGEQNERLQRLGLLPWWSRTDINAAFCRPLSALTHVLDYALWPDQPVLQHAHSLLWLALATSLVARLLRQTLPPAVAITAALLFAVDDAHAIPAGWLANRNALLTVVFGISTVLLHLRWRQAQRPVFLLGALGSLTLGLFCGEATLGALAYLAAWQLSQRPRLWPLLPYGVLVILWRLLYDHLGYGASGSGLYVDPGGQPLAFARALLERWPLLAAALGLQLPTDLWLFLPRHLQVVASVTCALLVGGLGWLLWPLLRDRPEARLWALGTGLSLVPLCAAFPMDRLLLFAGVGGFALLAMLWHDRARLDPVRRTLTVGLVILHGPLAAVALVLRTAVLLPVFGSIFAAGATQAPRDAALADQVLVFVTGSELPVIYTGIIRSVTGEAPLPRRISMLSALTVDNRVRREDDHTLLISPDGGFFRDPSERMFVGTERTFHAGEVLAGPDFDAEVRGLTPDGRPAQVAFRFREPLDSGAYCWVAWTPQGVQPYTLPPVGEEDLIEWTVPRP